MTYQIFAVILPERCDSTDIWAPHQAEAEAAVDNHSYLFFLCSFLKINHNNIYLSEYTMCTTQMYLMLFINRQDKQAY